MKAIDKVDFERFEAMQKSLRDQILMTNKYRRLYEDAQKDISAQKIYNASSMKLVVTRDERILVLEQECAKLHDKFLNAKNHITSTALAVVEGQRDDALAEVASMKGEIRELQGALQAALNLIET